MPFRFFRRKKILPGLTLNLSKSGFSVSAGPRGAKHTISTKGSRTTFGLPGTGLHYTNFKGHKNKKSSGNYISEKKVIKNSSKLNPGFFSKLFISSTEQYFIDGCNELIKENEKQALKLFEKSGEYTDSIFMAGILSFKFKKYKKAAKYLNRAIERKSELTQYFKKYDIVPTFFIPITDEIDVCIGPDAAGIYLTLTEIYKALKYWNKAFTCIKKLVNDDPEDIIIKLSFVELISDYKKNNKKVSQKVIQLTNNIKNESPVHAIVLLYRAKAFKNLKMFTAARDSLTSALRKKKGYSDKVLAALRYERGQIYSELNRKTQARKDFEKVYAFNQNYKNIKKYLGI
ncbi:MAG: DUF4236 domain-containing protein [Candidatus Muiribacteriota bacterium]